MRREPQEESPCRVGTSRSSSPTRPADGRRRGRAAADDVPRPRDHPYERARAHLDQRVLLLAGEQGVRRRPRRDGHGADRDHGSREERGRRAQPRRHARADDRDAADDRRSVSAGRLPRRRREVHPGLVAHRRREQRQLAARPRADRARRCPRVRAQEPWLRVGAAAADAAPRHALGGLRRAVALRPRARARPRPQPGGVLLLPAAGVGGADQRAGPTDGRDGDGPDPAGVPSGATRSSAGP